METTAEKILAAASKLFMEHGFEQVTVRDICSEAGVNVASVNYYYKGKQQLIAAVIDNIFAKRSQYRLRILSNRRIKNEAEWRQVITEFIDSMVLDITSHDRNELSMIRLFLGTLQVNSDFFKTLYQKYFAPLNNELRRYIQMGLPEDSPESDAELWVMTIISQCFFFRQHSELLSEISQVDFHQPEAQQRVARHIADMVFAALHYRPDAADAG